MHEFDVLLFTQFRVNSEMTENGPMIYGILMFTANLCYGISVNFHFFYGFYYAMKIRVALSSLIYRKVSLRLTESMKMRMSSIFSSINICSIFIVSNC